MVTQDDLLAAQTEAQQWQRYYEAVFSGEEDPRLAQLQQDAKVAEYMLEQQRLQAAEKEKAYKELLEKDAERYMLWVNSQYKDTMDGLTPEQGEKVLGLLDYGYELHDILDIFKMDPSALVEAEALGKDNVDPQLALRVLKAEFSNKPKPAPKVEPPSPAAKLVAGADNTQRNPEKPPSNDKKPMGRMERLRHAARIATQAHKR
jgi:hypothetical protein